MPSIEDVAQAPAPSLISERRRWMDMPQVATSTPVADAVVENLRSQRRERSGSRGKDHSESMQSFLAERTATSKDVRGNRRNQIAGQTLCCEKSDEKHKYTLINSEINQFMSHYLIDALVGGSTR